jgi:hypothetical protein
MNAPHKRHVREMFEMKKSINFSEATEWKITTELSSSGFPMPVTKKIRNF